MASKKKNLNKVYISIGKVNKKQPDGSKKAVEEFIVLPEETAKYIGAAYSLAAPKPRTVTITKGLLKGRSYLKEVSVQITGRKYQIGYIDGLKPKVGDQKRQVKIKWLSIFIDKHITLRTVLKAIRGFKKKPIYFKTPDGVSTRFVY